MAKRIDKEREDRESDAKPCCPKCGEALLRTRKTGDVRGGLWGERARGVVLILFVCPTGLPEHWVWRPEAQKNPWGS